jgi:hypothetical protein
MTAEARLAVEHMIATNPATRAMLSNPGRETKVTEALKIMAACRARDISGSNLGETARVLTTTQAHDPITNIWIGPVLRKPLSSSNR